MRCAAGVGSLRWAPPRPPPQCPCDPRRPLLLLPAAGSGPPCGSTGQAQAFTCRGTPGLFPVSGLHEHTCYDHSHTGVRGIPSFCLFGISAHGSYADPCRLGTAGSRADRHRSVYTQCGAQTHDPEVQSPTLSRLSPPGTSGGCFALKRPAESPSRAAGPSSLTTLHVCTARGD